MPSCLRIGRKSLSSFTYSRSNGPCGCVEVVRFEPDAADHQVVEHRQELGLGRLELAGCPQFFDSQQRLFQGLAAVGDDGSGILDAGPLLLHEPLFDQIAAAAQVGVAAAQIEGGRFAIVDQAAGESLVAAAGRRGPGRRSPGRPSSFCPSLFQLREQLVGLSGHDEAFGPPARAGPSLQTATTRSGWLLLGPRGLILETSIFAVCEEAFGFLALGFLVAVFLGGGSASSSSAPARTGSNTAAASASTTNQVRPSDQHPSRGFQQTGRLTADSPSGDSKSAPSRGPRRTFD